MSALRRCAALVVTALAAIAVVNVASTFLPGAPVFGMGLTLAGFVAVIPLSVAAVLWVVLGRRRGNDVNKELERQWTLLSRPLRTRLGALVIALWLCGLSGFILGPRGAPHAEGDRYYLNNHGAETDITHEEYDDARQHEVRSYASGTAVLLVAAAGILRYYRPRR